MRVAFLSQQAAFLDAVSRQQAAIARAQEQVSTGLKFSRAGQDPVGATQSLSLDALIANNQRYITNAGLAANRLQLEEGALTNVGDLLQRVRELVLQAANGPQSAESRGLIAAELRARLDELVALANTRDGNGEYLFAGTAAATQPFVRSAGSVSYQGDQVQRLVQVASDQYVADSDAGSAVFELIRNGNGAFSVSPAASNSGTALLGAYTLADPRQYDQGSYQLAFATPGSWEVRDAANLVIASGAYIPGDAINFRGISIELSGTPAAGDSFQVAAAANQSVFATVENLLAVLARPDGTPADQTALSNELAGTLNDLDQALGRIFEVRAGIGARLAALESRQSGLADTNVELASALSGLRDTDYAEVLTRLEQRLTGLEAAQKVYLRAAGLSLFDYL